MTALFAAHGVSATITETYSLEPQYTILAIDPPTTTLSVSGTLTLTVSSGGRVNLGAQLPGVLIESAQFSRDDYAPGMNAQFEVTWRGTRNVGKDYSVFVHLHDPSGNFMAQTGDREPRNRGASYPTSIWNASTVVVDSYVLQIPLTAQPGLYEIRIGLYDGAGRLAVSEPGATAVKSDGVVVRTIRVR